MSPLAIKQLNGLALAYLGDSSWELMVRTHLIEEGLTKPQHLHQAAIRYVSAAAQAELIVWLQNEQLLSEDEIWAFKRGRNSSPHSSAKNASMATYRLATGFEALMGYLYLADEQGRFVTIASMCIERVEQTDDKKTGQ
ncbi:MAG: ribonuclease III domain-containing protein [Aerococcus sp.]|nr:ribonuclease III domain-containing protein [Aerococcus sp.]